jgi:hypothetical protein
MAIMLGATWLGRSATHTQAAPTGPNDLYFPLVNRLALPPMVSLQQAYVANASGSPQAAFLPGSAFQYVAQGNNGFTFPINVTRRWTQDGPQSDPSACGDGLLFSNPLNLPPGSWQDSIQSAAAGCEGIYTATVDVSNGVETQALAFQYVINPPSQVVLETRQAFDRCTLPDLPEMLAWWEMSPYWVFNIYLGGSMFFCQNDIPDPVWVHSAARQGWSFILTWVGPQAPCTNFRVKMSSNPSTSYSQGRTEAALATEAARQRGFLGGMAIYYDMEAYGSTATQACRDAVDAFMRGWAERLHELGVVAGGYGSPATSHIADWADNSPPPDDVWIAHWLTPAQYRPDANTDSSYLNDSLWANHQRLRQYAGGHNEEWGNVTMNIDSSAVDGAVTCIPLPGAVCGQNPWPLTSQNAPTTEQSASIHAAELATPDWGWALVDNRLLATADGGATWQEITPEAASQQPILDVKFVDAQRGWLVSEADGGLTVFSTQDAGLTWKPGRVETGPISAPVGGASLEFIDESNGWLAVRLQSGSSFSLGLLFATQDGGLTWQPRSLPLGEEATFRDALHGWTAGGPDGAQLYATQDGGFTWQAQRLELPPEAQAGRVSIGLPQVSADSAATLAVRVKHPDGSERALLYRSVSGVEWEIAEQRPLDMADLSDFFCSGQPCEGFPPSGRWEVKPSNRWALAPEGSCMDKAAGQCQQIKRLYATSDGGDTWIDISPP